MIDVVEREAACAVAFGALYLADADGNVFKRATPEEAAALPVVTGIAREDYVVEPERSREQLKQALRAIARLAARQTAARGPPLGEVHVDRIAGVTVYTERGIGVRLGVVDDTLPARLRALSTPSPRRSTGGGEEARLVYVDNRARPDRVTVKLASAPIVGAQWIAKSNARTHGQARRAHRRPRHRHHQDRCIVGEVTDDGVDIIGVGTHPSTGLKKGVVVNIDATVQSIQQAVDEAEHMAGVEITHGLRRHRGRAHQVAQLAGRVAVKDKEVRESDIAAVLEQAKAIDIPLDREILHVLPQEYTIDDQDGIREPLGMCRRAPRGQGAHRDRVGDRARRTSSSAATAAACRSPTSCSSRSRRPRRCWTTTRRSSASRSSTSAAAPPTWPSSPTARSCTPACSPSAATSSPDDIALRPAHAALARPRRSSTSTAARWSAMVGEDEMMEVAVGGRPRAARAVARAVAVRDHRAARRGDLHARAGARSSARATTTSSPRARSSPAARRSSEGMPELAEQVLGMPVRRGVAEGRRRPGRRRRARPTYATGVGLVPLRRQATWALSHFQRGDADKRTVWQRMRSWFGEVF